ncbi:hypothetical protein [Pseudodesulfovibrio sediminis]|uniref:Pentapeptide repeat-containing protein n=1 Tax=Pseudodesulfovibrio sediminis TaxID=2810563 RepID=A0ABM7P3X5_9BACT|nr:hypothetical protein [Pseudodesulfovibrio sediminis]BCS88327.1 hypothetical protein PSDVSF_15690 [Pseudodesulfovibrio sediminis]
MRCYRCDEFEWETDEEIVEVQNDGRGLCLFHQRNNNKGKKGDDEIGGFNDPALKDRVDKASDRLNQLVRDKIEEAVEQKKVCNLSGAFFHSRFVFPDFTYLPAINFHGACFENKLDLQNKIFEGHFYFSKAITRGLDFSGSLFLKGADFSKVHFHRHSVFTSCEVAKPNSIKMHGVPSFNHVSFSGTEFRLFDFLEKDADHAYFLQRENIFRSMKKAAEDSADRVKYSEWHFLEREAQRAKYRSRDKQAYTRFKELNNGSSNTLISSVYLLKMKIRHFLFSRLYNATWWYWRLSGYGEKHNWALMSFLLVFVLTWCLLGFGGIQNDEGMVIQGLSLTADNALANAGHVFRTLVMNSLLFKYSSIPFKPVAGWAETILIGVTRLVMPLLAALFAFALRNKLRR